MSQAVLPLHHQSILINHQFVIKVVLVMLQAALPLQIRILMVIPTRQITMVEDKGGIGWSLKTVRTKDSGGDNDALDSGETNKLFIM